VNIDAIDLSTSAILLDVDGTLLDIAPTPHAVEVPSDLRRILGRLSEQTGGALALVSGRPISDLDSIFAPFCPPAIGGHGAEMRLSGEKIAFTSPSLSAELKKSLQAVSIGKPGVLVEDKKYGVAVHFRLAPQFADAVRKEVDAICAMFPAEETEILRGKSVVDVKRGAFNKGTGVRELMLHAPFRGRRPIFIGDDVTDEAAFAVMPEYKGLSLAVGDAVGSLDGAFAGPAEVRRWLRMMAGMQETAGSVA
jgi:trehalose 6-phosphate phosphatase